MLIRPLASKPGFFMDFRSADDDTPHGNDGAVAQALDKINVMTLFHGLHCVGIWLRTA